MNIPQLDALNFQPDGSIGLVFPGQQTAAPMQKKVEKMTPPAKVGAPKNRVTRHQWPAKPNQSRTIAKRSQPQTKVVMRLYDHPLVDALGKLNVRQMADLICKAIEVTVTQNATTKKSSKIVLRKRAPAAQAAERPPAPTVRTRAPQKIWPPRPDLKNVSIWTLYPFFQN